MSELIIKFPPEIKPYVDAYKQSYVGVLAWQQPELINPLQIDASLTKLEAAGKINAGIAISKDLDGLPFGPNPNISHPVRRVLMPLVKAENDHVVVITSLTQFLIGHCYAIMEENGKLEPHRTDPVIQFLRHTRNGCFHGNRFNIEPLKPRKVWHSAKWRGREITIRHNGVNVFRPNLAKKGYFLNWGDALLLLSDACAIVY